VHRAQKLLHLGRRRRLEVLEIDLHVQADIATFCKVWLGRQALGNAMREGRVMARAVRAATRRGDGRRV